MRNFKLKKIIAGIAILSTGYGIALFLPPDQIPFLKNLNLSLLNVETVKSVAEEAKKLIESETVVLKETKSPSNVSESGDLESKIAANPTYLREFDLFQIPGLGESFSLRVGPPVTPSEAKKILENLPKTQPSFPARFQTATGQAKAIVFFGELQNRDQAELLRDSMQPNLTEILDVVYLPRCVTEGDTDDENFFCGDPSSDTP